MISAPALTDEFIFESLCRKARQKVRVRLLLASNGDTREVDEIILLVEQRRLDEADSCIVAYLNTRKQVVIYIDPERSEVKLELKALEVRTGAPRSEKQEMERMLHAYQIRRDYS